jgi:hypothetical protein
LFTGTVNLVTTGISNDEPATIGVRCDASQFDGVLEIAADEVRPERYRTMVAVDVVGADKRPTILPGARIIRQLVIGQKPPSILITAFENP